MFKEEFQKGKSKIKWHLDQDRNTKYLHQVPKIKNGFKKIVFLRNGAHIRAEQEDIQNHTSMLS